MRVIATALQVSRSNLVKQQRPRPKRYQKEDKELVSEIAGVIRERPTYGYRRIGAMLNKKCPADPVNHKRIYRVMKSHHLLLSRPDRRPLRSHSGKVETLHRNIRWCSDSFSIQCFNGDQVHVAFSMDTCDREVMGYIASTIGIDGQAIRDLMLETVEGRFGEPTVPHPIEWLSDNGKCYTARDTVAFGRSLGLEIRTTLPYSPQSNGMAEAFVKTIKRDYVWPGDLKDAKGLCCLNLLPRKAGLALS